MPQSKNNTSISISRELHAELVKILEDRKAVVKAESGLDVDFSLSGVVKMLVDNYKKS